MGATHINDGLERVPSLREDAARLEGAHLPSR